VFVQLALAGPLDDRVRPDRPSLLPPTPECPSTRPADCVELIGQLVEPVEDVAPILVQGHGARVMVAYAALWDTGSSWA
jgi:hypothetical protein